MTLYVSEMCRLIHLTDIDSRESAKQSNMMHITLYDFCKIYKAIKLI